MKVYVTIHPDNICKVHYTEAEALEHGPVYPAELQHYEYRVEYRKHSDESPVTIASFPTRAAAGVWIKSRYLEYANEFTIRSVPHEPTE